MQKTKIEWTDFVCNPVKGLCKMGCQYCYATKMYKRFKWNPEIRFDESELQAIDKIKIVKGGWYCYLKVFMGSTHDLFGDWIPDVWIHKIIQKAIDNPKIIFIFLTKNPKRYSEFEFPLNAWIGYSTIGHLYHKWDDIHTENIKFVSLEPLQERMTASLEGYAQRINFNWLIIGQETGTRTQKHFVKVDELESTVEFAQRAGMKIFIKNNLLHLNKELREYPDFRM